MVVLSFLCLALAGVAAWLWGQRTSLTAQLTAEKSQRELLCQQAERERDLQRQRFDTQMQLNGKQLREQFDAEMQQRTRQLRQTSQETMEQVTRPLRDEMRRLQQLVDTQRQEHTRQSGLLEASIKAVVEHDRERDKTTQSLADALRNRGKVQGDWGEQVLENILRDSGLREGEEYEKQLSITAADGHRDRPDVVVRGAGGAVVVIDSKVSLTAYTDYCGAENDAERQQAELANYNSVWQHVRELSRKKYPAAVEGAVPVTLMFVPNEGSYQLAMNHDPQLGVKAYKENVFIVNPTNLMVVLRLMFLSWQHTHQERNNRAIVDAASKIYEKYATFCESYILLGKNLDSARNTYERGLGQMRDGRDNLGKQMQSLLQMGVTPTKELPPDALPFDPE